MAIHKKFTSNDLVLGDKFHQQGNHNKMLFGGSKETKARRLFAIIGAPIIVGLLLLSFEYFGFMNISSYFSENVFNIRQSASPVPTVAPQNVADGCTRETRLDNDPQYDRALSLIQQRIDDQDKWCDKYCETDEYEKKLRFHQFPANLTNCIKIVEERIDGDAEGYFTFDSKDIQPNYFPIVVDESYNFADDTLTSLLITHEMTHVQQYIDNLKETSTLSCRDKEVEAFISQIDYYVLLNNEEINSVVLKMNSDKGKMHPQIAMLKTMIDINRDGTCPLFADQECSQNHLRSKLFELVTQSPSYRNQCEL